MKDFIISFIIVLALSLIFVFFGGTVFLDFSGHFWLSFLFCALCLSSLVWVLFRQSEKIEELEKRIEFMENDKNGTE